LEIVELCRGVDGGLEMVCPSKFEEQRSRAERAEEQRVASYSSRICEGGSFKFTSCKSHFTMMIAVVFVHGISLVSLRPVFVQLVQCASQSPAIKHG